jgi:hypothetical protein
MEYRGGCHCGNLSLVLRLPRSPGEVRVRACGCSFCRAHNTRTVSDPQGSVEVWARDWSLVEPYRFGSKTAEFLICRRCGVYIGAFCETAAGTRAVVNTNCLADRALFGQSAARSITRASRPTPASPAAPPTGRRRRCTGPLLEGSGGQNALEIASCGCYISSMMRSWGMLRIRRPILG